MCKEEVKMQRERLRHRETRMKCKIWTGVRGKAYRRETSLIYSFSCSFQPRPLYLTLFHITYFISFHPSSFTTFFKPPISIYRQDFSSQNSPAHKPSFHQNLWLHSWTSLVQAVELRPPPSLKTFSSSFSLPTSSTGLSYDRMEHHEGLSHRYLWCVMKNKDRKKNTSINGSSTMKDRSRTVKSFEVLCLLRNKYWIINHCLKACVIDKMPLYDSVRCTMQLCTCCWSQLLR